MPGGGVKVTIYVACVAQDGSLPKGPSWGASCDVLLLLSLIAIFGLIWAAPPLISGANHFESAIVL